MITPIETTKEFDTLRVEQIRCEVYGLLAACFAFPTEGLKKSADKLSQISLFLYEDLEPLGGEVALEHLEPDYINVLDGLDKKNRAQPYEGAWTQGDRAKRQWEITRFYKVFGLKLPADKVHAPDHIVHEFEFMQALTYWITKNYPYVATETSKKQAVAQKEKAERYSQSLLAQRDFLKRHIVNWVPTFCESLAKNTGQDFYKNLAHFTSRFVQEDLTWVEERFGEG